MILRQLAFKIERVFTECDQWEKVIKPEFCFIRHEDNGEKGESFFAENANSVPGVKKKREKEKEKEGCACTRVGGLFLNGLEVRVCERREPRITLSCIILTNICRVWHIVQ